MNKTNFLQTIAVALLIIINFNNAFSQNLPNALSKREWRMGGNSGTGAGAQATNSSVFGTFFNQPIFFYTNSTPKMTLTTAGFLGLGTTNPQSLLHLKGGQVAYLQISNDHTAAFGDQGFSLGLDVNGTAEFIQRHDSPISFKLRNIPGNAIIERLTILNSGNVGIGTPSPVDQLEVVAGNRKVGLNTAIPGISPGGVISFSRPVDAAKVALVGVSATASNDFVLYGAGGGSEVRLVSGGGSGSGFGFYSGASTGINSNTAFATARPTSNLVMKITGAGNVGIGKYSKANLLLTTKKNNCEG